MPTKLYCSSPSLVHFFPGSNGLKPIGERQPQKAQNLTTLSIKTIFILSLMIVLFNKKAITQDTLSLEYKMNNPIQLYDTKFKIKQQELKKKLNVVKLLSCRIINETRDSTFFEYNENGEIASSYYTETKMKRLAKENELGYNSGGIDMTNKWHLPLRLHNTSNYENGEFVTRDTTGKIIRRLRNTFMKEDLVFIHESIDEETLTPTFRTVMKLNENLDVIASTCFDGARKTTFSTIYIYDKNGNRTKMVKYADGKMEPVIEYFEYCDNGLLKKEVEGSITTEYEYEYK